MKNEMLDKKKADKRTYRGSASHTSYPPLINLPALLQVIEALYMR